MITTLNLETIYAPVQAGMSRVPALIRETLDTPILKMREMVDHFFFEEREASPSGPRLFGSRSFKDLEKGTGDLARAQ